MASEHEALHGPAERVPLSPHFAAINDVGPDDRPVPALGLGDEQAATALLLATRQMLSATTVDGVVAAVAAFAVQLGGELVPAGRESGRALPLDISLATSAPVLVDADPLSVTRMRLEQYLPGLLEDARRTFARVRHLADVERVAAHETTTGLLTRSEMLRQLAALRTGDVVCLVEIDSELARCNDALGSLTSVLRAALALSASVGRHVDDQVLVLQPAVPIQVAAARLRQAGRHWAAMHPRSARFSVGLAAVGVDGWADASIAADAALCASRQDTTEVSVRGESST